MNILFVCKYNRFRSRVAEACFKKINRNKTVYVNSAGLIPGRYPLDRQQVVISKQFGLNINGKPKPVTTELLRWADILVIAANDVPLSIFKSKEFKFKIVNWKIKDETEGNSKNVERIVKQIIKRIDKLNKELEKRK
ncbi:MAG: low molecular weight phosphatase family protein [Nanoarchaeota archaeon]|nr:low molecular weight phosphatase family protein [Nanoarchaeota archaeon]